MPCVKNQENGVQSFLFTYQSCKFYMSWFVTSDQFRQLTLLWRRHNAKVGLHCTDEVQSKAPCKNHLFMTQLAVDFAAKGPLNLMPFLVARATLSSALNPVFRRSHRSRAVLTVWVGCALNEVRDVKEYVTGLEVSPTGRLEGFWATVAGNYPAPGGKLAFYSYFDRKRVRFL